MEEGVGRNRTGRGTSVRRGRGVSVQMMYAWGGVRGRGAGLGTIGQSRAGGMGYGVVVFMGLDMMATNAEVVCVLAEGADYFLAGFVGCGRTAEALSTTAEKHRTLLKYPVLIDQLIRRIHQLDTTYQPFYPEQQMEAEERDDPDDIAEFFKVEGNLFDFETPLCKAFDEFNYLLKIDTDLFTFDIQGIQTYEEYELNNTMTRNLEEPWLDNGVAYQLCDHICESYRFKNGMTKWPMRSSDIDGFCNGGELPGMVRVGCMTYFQDHKWYDELVDGKLKEETLMHKAKVAESWGDATPGVMKLYAWLKNTFENFYKLDYNVLVKLQECWWKVNTHEVIPFTPWKSYGQNRYFSFGRHLEELHVTWAHLEKK
ncbi:hypothetical protein Tco_0604112 [Tanacetum coccineum]